MAYGRWSTVQRSHRWATGRPGLERQHSKVLQTPRCGGISVAVVCPHSMMERCSVYLHADRSPAGTHIWRPRQPLFYGDEKDAKAFAKRAFARLERLCRVG